MFYDGGTLCSYLRGDLLVAVDHVHVQSGEDDGVVPVEGGAVQRGVLPLLPLEQGGHLGYQLPFCVFMVQLSSFPFVCSYSMF